MILLLKEILAQEDNIVITLLLCKLSENLLQQVIDYPIGLPSQGNGSLNQ